MNTRNRPGRHTSPQPGTNRPPYGLGTPTSTLQARPQQPVFAARGLVLSPKRTPNPACATDPARPCRHPLTNESENRRLLTHEQAIKGHFAAIIPALKHLAACQREADFLERAQRIARADLGFELPVGILEDAWIANLDMRALYGACVMHTIRLMAEQTHAMPPQSSDE
ncbi:MAG: carboxysome shell carbonic anhydrase, partial [Acidithiobacillus ferrooxidans]